MPPAPPSRGFLLRETSRLSEAILQQSERAARADEDLSRAQASKAASVAAKAAAEGTKRELEAQRAAEAANDGELTALQRAGGVLVHRLSELARDITKRARPERDAARDAAALAHYARAGVEAEAARAVAAGDGASRYDVGGAMPRWSATPRSLLAEGDALWRRAAAGGVLVRDLVEAALQQGGAALTLAGGGAAGGVSPTASASPTAGALYGALGHAAALADAIREEAAARELLVAVGALQQRCADAAALAAAGEEEEGGVGEGAAFDDAVTLSAATAVAEALVAHVSLQVRLVAGARVALESSVGGTTGSGGHGGHLNGLQTEAPHHPNHQ